MLLFFLQIILTGLLIWSVFDTFNFGLDSAARFTNLTANLSAFYMVIVWNGGLPELTNCLFVLLAFVFAMLVLQQTNLSKRFLGGIAICILPGLIVLFMLHKQFMDWDQVGTLLLLHHILVVSCFWIGIFCFEDVEVQRILRSCSMKSVMLVINHCIYNALFITFVLFSGHFSKNYAAMARISNIYLLIYAVIVIVWHVLDRRAALHLISPLNRESNQKRRNRDLLWNSRDYLIACYPHDSLPGVDFDRLHHILRPHFPSKVIQRFLNCFDHSTRHNLWRYFESHPEEYTRCFRHLAGFMPYDSLRSYLKGGMAFGLFVIGYNATLLFLMFVLLPRV